jgi:dolichol-phosphate mannosyltransferase
LSISIIFGAVGLGLLVFQAIAFFILLSRLIKGARRRPPLLPRNATPEMLGTVSAIVPTLNEVDRVDPCLAGLSRQGYEVREILIVDSNSIDGTREKVKIAARTDPRVRLKTDDPLPADWVGRPWALHNGFLFSDPNSEWILGIDADTRPEPELVASIVGAAIEEGYDLLTLSPRFILSYPGEWWLQPALLMTLLYRFDSAGVRDQAPDRVMANGQCFLCRRSVLASVGGYEGARGSFCDDVTLARQIAKKGYRVGFLDGARIIRVRMYEGFRETWTEWGRSLDLKDATDRARLYGDLAVLLFTQGIPILVTPLLAIALISGYDFPTVKIALGLNGLLLFIRFALLLAVSGSYDRSESAFFPSLLFWLSPLADPLAVARIFLSAFTRPKRWRGREY